MDKAQDKTNEGQPDNEQTPLMEVGLRPDIERLEILLVVGDVLGVAVWQKATEKEQEANNGFSRFEHHHLAKCLGRGWRRGAKVALSKLPLKAQMRLNAWRKQPPTFFGLEFHNQVFSPLVDPFPREISLMVVYK